MKIDYLMCFEAFYQQNGYLLSREWAHLGSLFAHKTVLAITLQDHLTHKYPNQVLNFCPVSYTGVSFAVDVTWSSVEQPLS